MQMLERTGRRKLTVFSFAVCGTSCLICALLPNTGSSPLQALRIAAAVGGKFGGASAFILLYVYTIELFPTVVRNAALGANSSSARVGGIIAPLVVLLATEMNAAALSFVIFGITSIMAGVDESSLAGFVALQFRRPHLACVSDRYTQTSTKANTTPCENLAHRTSSPRLLVLCTTLHLNHCGTPSTAGGKKAHPSFFRSSTIGSQALFWC
jgi:MFS family permease